jgi:hypothetical protein
VPVRGGSRRAGLPPAAVGGDRGREGELRAGSVDGGPAENQEGVGCLRTLAGGTGEMVHGDVYGVDWRAEGGGGGWMWLGREKRAGVG